jgi:hypothetical protein
MVERLVQPGLQLVIRQIDLVAKLLRVLRDLLRPAEMRRNLAADSIRRLGQLGIDYFSRNGLGISTRRLRQAWRRRWRLDGGAGSRPRRPLLLGTLLLGTLLAWPLLLGLGLRLCLSPHLGHAA